VAWAYSEERIPPSQRELSSQTFCFSRARKFVGNIL
jgi:hypothetical protein